MSATAPPSEESAARPRQKRPASVTLVALLALGVAIYSITAGIVNLQDVDDDRLPIAIFQLAFGAGVLVAGAGAFRLHPWAWAAFMTWAVIGLSHQILRYLFFGDPNLADMAVNTVVVLALSPLEVQVAFGLRHTSNVQLARPTRNPVDSD